MMQTRKKLRCSRRKPLLFFRLANVKVQPIILLIDNAIMSAFQCVEMLSVSGRAVSAGFSFVFHISSLRIACSIIMSFDNRTLTELAAKHIKYLKPFGFLLFQGLYKNALIGREVTTTQIAVFIV